MNKDTTRLLQQLRGELDALRQRIATMETSLDELEHQLESEAAAPEAAETEAVDLSAVAVGAFSEPEAEPVPEPLAEPEPASVEAPVEDFPFPEPEVAPAPVPEPEPEPMPKPEPAPQPAPKPSPKAAVQESTDRYAWRKDMPGLAVRDIRSAIALNDRVLFINVLFQQDAVRFQSALNDLNGFETFPQAEDYLRTNYPQWNYDSEVVYRFMMAVRRKLR